MRRKGLVRRRKDPWQVRVRRDRPTGVAWAAALAITMLMVYLATLAPQADLRAQSAFAAPRVTREIEFGALDMYLVSLYGCQTGEEARLRASGFTGKGAAGYVYETDEGWQVLGAAYEESRDAERIAERLSSDENIDAQVVRIKADRVAMRITAPQVQIEAVAAAEALLRSQTAQLGDMALQLDRDEISSGAACTLCAVASTQATAAAQVLRQIPGANENDLCRRLIERLESLDKLLRAVAGAAGEAPSTLSGMLRCAQIDTFIGQAELQQALLRG